MAVTYCIDTERRLVISRAIGLVLVDDLVAYTGRLRNDPAFDPTFNQVFCFLDIDASGLDSNDMRRMASTSIFAEGTRRVFICPPGLIHGLGRAFSSYVDSRGEDVAIVHTRAEAASAFGLDEAAIAWPG